MKKVGIIGYGWLGAKISRNFAESFEMHATTTLPQKLKNIRSEGIQADLAVFNEDEKQFPDPWNIAPELDVIIITVPFSERRTSKEILQKKLSNLISFIGKFEKQLFFMSTTSVYPDESGIFKEEMLPSENVFTENKIKEALPQINILRLGGLMGDSRLLKNFNVSDLSGVVNHIHYEDVSAVILKMIEKDVRGKVYNVVAPLHPLKQEVIAAQNNQHTDDMQYNNKVRIISSEKLITELDFTFIHPDPKNFHLD